MATESRVHVLPGCPQPALAPSPAPPLPPSLPLPCLAPALLTGGLLILCHFTVLPVVCGWLAWVGLVPLLCLVRSPARPWRVYLSSWAGGLLFFWFVLQWMPVADDRMYYTWAALATYCSLFFPLGIFLVRRLDRLTRLPLVVTVPAVWTALDFFRAHFGTGFAWYFLGHTQHDYLPVIQIGDLAGAYGVTFLVAAVNALVFELFYTRDWFRSLFVLSDPGYRPGPLALLAQAVAVVSLVGATLLYGQWRLSQNDFEVGPRITLVQGNVPQRVRNAKQNADADGIEEAAKVMADSFADLSALAARTKPQLIVWPETSFPGDWQDLSPGRLAESRRDAARHYDEKGQGVQVPDLHTWHDFVLGHFNKDVMADAQACKTSVLLGLNTVVLAEGDHRLRYNSAVLLQPDGKYAGRYDKVHRVPFGEYVPLRDLIPAMNAFAPYDHDYSIAPGEGLTRLPLGDWRFGVVICYEDSDPYLARQFVRRSGEAFCDTVTRFLCRGTFDHLPRPADERPVDFLLNISNDGWFDGTSEHEEHLAICRFRAVECRRSVARAVNMGISAVIDPNGRVLAPRRADLPGSDVPGWEINHGAWLAELPTSRWAEFKKVPGVIVAEVPIDRRESLYARWGDWLPSSCGLLVGLGLLWPLRRRWMSERPQA